MRADEAGVTLLEISCDSQPVQAAWVNATLGADAHESAAVLSDFWPHGDVSVRYGVFNEERGMSMRSIFVVDVDGTVLYSEQFTQRGHLPDIEMALGMIEEL